MKFIFVLLSVFVFGALSEGKTSYVERAQFIRKMAEIVPGKTSRHTPSLGLLGGLYVQTKWQDASGRDGIVSWNHINSYLTVRSYHFFLNYISYGREACHYEDHQELCHEWLNYFLAADIRNLESQSVTGRLLWRAHMSSIYTALRDRPDVLDNMQVPSEERYFIKGWIRFVQYLADINFPTDERLAQILSNKTLPECAPLGAEYCRVKNLSFLKRTFTKKIIKLGKTAPRFVNVLAPQALQAMLTGNLPQATRH